MLAHKLVFEDFDSPFKLIAIHCSSEEYKLAFLLNRHLNLRLARTRKDHDYTFKTVRAEFPVYSYNHAKQYCDYYLLSNKFKVESESQATGSLFEGASLNFNLVYLLPQYKSVDYLLKIEEEFDSVAVSALVDEINQLPQVTTAYAIDTETLKFKENLIFD